MSIINPGRQDVDKRRKKIGTTISIARTHKSTGYILYAWTRFCAISVKVLHTFLMSLTNHIVCGAGMKSR